nr:hypothetical protein [Tanacetum cinerariifolium]
VLASSPEPPPDHRSTATVNGSQPWLTVVDHREPPPKVVLAGSIAGSGRVGLMAISGHGWVGLPREKQSISLELERVRTIYVNIPFISASFDIMMVFWLLVTRPRVYLREPPTHVAIRVNPNDHSVKDLLAAMQNQPECRIIEPLASRCAKFRFTPLSEDIMSTRILHICNEEGLNLDPEALATLSSISQGDLRRAITFLQGVAHLFGSSIYSKDLISISGVIPHEVVQALLAACKSGSFDFTNKEVNNVIAKGYPLFDMVVESKDMTDEQKARIFKKLGESDKVKENQEKDKIGSKPDKNGKRGEARKSQKQLQLKEEEKPKKTKKEWPKTNTRIKTKRAGSPRSTVCGYFVGYNMSYQEMRYNIFKMWRKCGLKSVIPNGNGIFLFKFKSAEGLKYVTEMRHWMANGKPMFVKKWDPSVSLDKAEPSAQPLWVKLKNLPLETWSSKGISAVASRLGTPLIMDQTTTNMCNLGNGRPDFARVLVNVEAVKDEFMEEEMNELKQNQVNDEFVQVQHRKKGGRKMNITENHKKETMGNKSKNVVYRPVEKSNLVAAEGTKHGTEEDQMNGMNSPKENTKQKSGGSNAKKMNRTYSQKKDRNMNSFEILSEYDDMEGIEKELQCEDKVLEEDDVFEGSGMVNSMKGMSTSDKQNEVAKFTSDEKLQGCRIIVGWNRELVILNRVHMTDQTMLCIDMNVILNTNEHSAWASFVSSEMQEFKGYVNMIEVEDLCSSGLFFTWTKNMKKSRAGDKTGILKKLDRVMVNEDFMKKYSQTHVIFNPYLVSDHSQAVIIFPNSMKKKNTAFKFANFVADKDDFKTIVEKEWRTKVGGFQMFQLVKKLRNLKVHLKKLSWQNGNLFEKVDKIRDNLKNIQRDIDKDPYNKALRKEDVAILKEYMTTREDEEKILFQKSKIKWLSLGDRNNSFFHKTLKGRYQKSIIEKIQDVNGNSFEGQDVANQFVMHFKKFLSSSHKVEGIGECHSLFKNKVNETEALSLIEDVSSKEIVTPPKMCRSGNMYRERYFIIQHHKIYENGL